MGLLRTWTCPCGTTYRLERHGQQPAFYWPPQLPRTSFGRVHKCVTCSRNLRDTRRSIELNGRQLELLGQTTL